MRPRSLAFAVAILFGISHSSQGSATIFTDRAAFEAAIGAHSLLTFDTAEPVHNGSEIGGHSTDFFVVYDDIFEVFGDHLGLLVLGNGSGTLGLASDTGTSAFTIQPVWAIGFDVIPQLCGGVVPCQEPLAGICVDGFGCVQITTARFFGVVFDTPTKASISVDRVFSDGSIHQGYAKFDNVAIKTVPEPFDFSGFFLPIENVPFVNQVRAGAVVPLKFSLGGDQSLKIFSFGLPTPISQPVGCTTLGSLASVEETLSAGNSGLRYDAALDQYTYSWKTERAWAGSCRQLVIRLIDGSFHIAKFQLR